MMFLKAQIKAQPVIFGLLILTLLLGSVFTSAQAQKRLKFSTTEDIAIAFYKTGGKIPNFDRWIKEREPYSTTPWARRAAMLKQETSRLQLAYQNFKPNKDFITIRTFVNLAPQEQKNKAGEKTYTLPITFSGAPEALYFPYDFLDQRIVVMPSKMDKVMKAQITESDYRRITEALRTSAKNTMIVRLRTTESDFSKPYLIDGIPQWVLKTEIVSLEVWSKQGRLLWEYSAPWYISPNTTQLNNLFEKRPSGSGEKGAVKPLFSVK